MKPFLPVILGTDMNSYSVARCIRAAYDVIPAVCGSNVLIPFYHSKHAKQYIRKNFSTDDHSFVDTLEAVYADNKNDYESFIIFVPSEEFLYMLHRNLHRLSFKPIIPYPKPEMARHLMIKANFYRLLESLGVRYPKTEVVGPSNFERLSMSGELFLKADCYDDFVRHSFEGQQKGYRAKDREEALGFLRTIYASGFQGEMIIQTYIHGEFAQEYSLNGYRASDGTISMVQARSILSDMRPMWVGNHIVQIDSHIDALYEIAEHIADSFDYHGLFNLDFKIDAVTGEVYVLELNTRQGRTFFYSHMGGVNLVETAIEDLIFGRTKAMLGSRPFRLMTIPERYCAERIEMPVKPDFEAPERVANSGNPILDEQDFEGKRREAILSYLERQGEGVNTKA